MTPLQVVALKPAFALAALSFVVWGYLYALRILSMRNGGSLTSAGARDKGASENFHNLFELPLLLYPATLIAMVCNLATPAFMLLAWVFVGLRVLHSVIQCTYNKASHRFAVYIVGIVVLGALWVYLLLRMPW